MLLHASSRRFDQLREVRVSVLEVLERTWVDLVNMGARCAEEASVAFREGSEGP